MIHRYGLALLVSTFLWAPSLWASSGMSREDLSQLLWEQSDHLTFTEINDFIDRLAADFEAGESEEIPIAGFLWARGFNAAYFWDRDIWKLNATLVDPDTGLLLTVPGMFEMQWANHGLKVEWAYKWVFVFLARGTSVQDLDGVQSPRGIGATLSPGVGFDASRIPNPSSESPFYIYSYQVGLSAGLMRPTVRFRQVKPL